MSHIHLLALGALIALGFFLGMRHATDPDHVVAVATIVTRQGSLGKAAWIGACWGLGHTTTIFGVGAAIILFKVVIPPRLGLSMELAVGLMLILLGVMNLCGFTRRIPHRHAAPDAAPGATARGGRTMRGSFAVGIVHGLAGSAAVALLVLGTIGNPYWALCYLLLFGVGTIAGMMLITLGMAGAIVGASRHSSFVQRNLNFASGLVSLCFGLFVAYQIGFVNGLFTHHPQWTPH